MLEKIKVPVNRTDTIFISINTNACLVTNTALLEIDNDPGNQLLWLEENLMYARQSLKKVIIAGNLHPGSAKCNRQWSQRYSSLIDAFQDVVRMQLFSAGEDHKEFELFRDLDTGTPIQVANVGGSLSLREGKMTAVIRKVDLESSFPIKYQHVVIPTDLTSLPLKTSIE